MEKNKTLEQNKTHTQSQTFHSQVAKTPGPSSGSSGIYAFAMMSSMPPGFIMMHSNGPIPDAANSSLTVTTVPVSNIED